MEMRKEQAVAAVQAADESNLLASSGYEMERIPAGGWRLIPTVEVALHQVHTNYGALEEALAAAAGSLVTVRA